jgi:hypothetical protein
MAFELAVDQLEVKLRRQPPAAAAKATRAMTSAASSPLSCGRESGGWAPTGVAIAIPASPASCSRAPGSPTATGSRASAARADR